MALYLYIIIIIYVYTIEFKIQIKDIANFVLQGTYKYIMFRSCHVMTFDLFIREIYATSSEIDGHYQSPTKLRHMTTTSLKY